MIRLRNLNRFKKKEAMSVKRFLRPITRSNLFSGVNAQVKV